jgi:hypothetical protein
MGRPSSVSFMGTDLLCRLVARWMDRVGEIGGADERGFAIVPADQVDGGAERVLCACGCGSIFRVVHESAA